VYTLPVNCYLYTTCVPVYRYTSSFLAFLRALRLDPSKLLIYSSPVGLGSIDHRTIALLGRFS
jgi:hypothetical protein